MHCYESIFGYKGDRVIAGVRNTAVAPFLLLLGNGVTERSLYSAFT